MHLTLLQLNNLVHQTIQYSMPQSYWVEAEVLDLTDRTGHCYMDLVQKDEHSNTPVAKARANCWQNVWMRLRPRFERATGQQIRSGMKVLLLVKASFHEAYGFAWVVQDIDPTYTMGDLARRRLEIIRTLKEEGVFDLNKSLELPLFAKRIAVISSETAAGYGDFCDQLMSNDYGFQFETTLFPAIMQGESVEQSVISALDRINQRLDDFDVVVIIRGGGATADLTGFDTLALAENVANFPLPIITGIGHDRDESILDMISCVRVKTPTAAATFLIDHLGCTLAAIEDCEQRIIDCVRARLHNENLRLANLQSIISSSFSVRKVREEAHLTNLSMRLHAATAKKLQTESSHLQLLSQRLPMLTATLLQQEKHRLDLLEHRVSALDPIHILRRGYSITLHNGKVVKDPAALQPGDALEILLAEGRITAEALEVKSKK